MRADQAGKLAQFVSSGEFLKRVNEAIGQACDDLRAHGIEPVRVDRKTSRIVGGEANKPQQPAKQRD
jgi:hypothetical protein